MCIISPSTSFALATLDARIKKTKKSLNLLEKMTGMGYICYQAAWSDDASQTKILPNGHDMLLKHYIYIDIYKYF